MNKLFSFFKFSIGSFILSSYINRNMFSVKQVNDIQSMTPSFNPKIKSKNDLTFLRSDYILLWKVDYKNYLKENKGCQLVYMNHPNEDRRVTRMLVAMPGEWVKDKYTEVFRRIPDGHGWVECIHGDDDSTTWGPIPLPLIIGRPVLKIRPFKKLVLGKKIENNIYKKLHLETRILKDENMGVYFE